MNEQRQNNNKLKIVCKHVKIVVNYWTTFVTKRFKMIKAIRNNELRFVNYQKNNDNIQFTWKESETKYISHVLFGV